MGESKINNKTYVLCIVLILLVASALSFLYIGRQPFTNDETIVIFNIKGVPYYWVPHDLGRDISSYGDEHRLLYSSGFPSMGTITKMVIRNEGHPPLHFWLVSLWSRALGITHAGVRSFSAVFSILSVLMLIVTIAYLLDRKTAVLTGAVFAILPMRIWHAQDARNYAMLGLISICTIYCFARAIKERSPKWTVLLGICYTVGLYTHYFYAILVAVQFVYLLTRSDRWQALKTTWFAFAGSIILFSFWLPSLHAQTTGYPMAPGTDKLTIAAKVKMMVWVLSTMWFNARVYLSRVTVTLATAVAWGLMLYWAAVSRKRDDNAKYLTWLALAPWLICFAAAAADLRPAHWAAAKRYYLFLPAMTTVLVCSLTTLRRSLAVACTALLLFVGIWSSAFYYFAPNRADTASAARAVRRLANDRDLVVTTGSTSEISYYVDGLPNRVSTRDWTPEINQWFAEVVYYDHESSPTNSVQNPVRRWLQSHYREVSSYRGDFVSVIVYRAP